MPLNPEATNLVLCSSCGWTRIIDHKREYRGGHVNPATGADCHEMLMYKQLSPLRPEVALLGEDRAKATHAQLSSWASSEDADDRQRARDEEQRSRDIDERLAEVYEIDDLDDPIFDNIVGADA